MKNDSLEMVESRLKQYGLSDAWWIGLREKVFSLPGQFDKLNRETDSESQARRASLANKMKRLSLELNSDPDASLFIPVTRPPADPFLLIASASDQQPSIGDWLDGCADSLVELPARAFESRAGNSRKSFVIRATYDWIEHYLAMAGKFANRSHNKETATLAAAALGEPVSANDVTQLRKPTRRKYCME